MNKINVITIDGPSASGKGSLAMAIAESFNFSLLDSGSLYRLLAYLVNKGESIDSASEIINKNVKFVIRENNLLVLNNNIDISEKIRTEKIAGFASELSGRIEVRRALFEIQRSFYNENGLVADGRDMGTVVFKDAKLKIFLTASPQKRAKRRYLELQKRGQEVNMPDLIADIEQRDLKDSSRELSPLLPADDAHVIDSSEMSLEEVVMISKNLIAEEYL